MYSDIGNYQTGVISGNGMPLMNRSGNDSSTIHQGSNTGRTTMTPGAATTTTMPSGGTFTGSSATSAGRTTTTTGSGTMSTGTVNTGTTSTGTSSGMLAAPSGSSTSTGMNMNTAGMGAANTGATGMGATSGTPATVSGSSTSTAPSISITPPNFNMMNAGTSNAANTSNCSDNNGVLPPCAPLAVPYVPFQQEGSKRYNQTEALNNGTLFPSLNLPFHVKAKGTDVVTTALAELQAVGFVAHELALYLDTHPTDQEAFTLFQQYTAMEKEATERYERTYGPISRDSAANATEYTWIDNPWPWDRQEGK